MEREKIELLIETIQHLSMARDMNVLTDIVRKAARKLTGADGATFILKEDRFCYYADEDAIDPLWKGRRFPMEICVSGWAMLNKKPAIIEDIYKDNRVPIDAYKPTFVKSLVIVPIRTFDPIGAIGNYWAQQHLADSDEIFLLQSLADITSVSIENIYLYRNLEDKVKERTHLLEEANKTLQSFNYSVSHDLRSPLRVFQGYSEILLAKHAAQLADEGKMLLKKMMVQADNMSQLLTGLMEFSKIGMAEIRFEEIHVSSLVREVCDSFKEREKNREIVFEIGELPDAMGDALLIKQVWTNLISNAIKYTGKKPVARIEIGARLPSGELCYYIKDNGDGFDMKYADKLFHVFQRLHSDSEFEGNGVGLALVEKIIAKHDGKIWAEAKPGIGAAFFFTLPYRFSK